MYNRDEELYDVINMCNNIGIKLYNIKDYNIRLWNRL